ncbi:hypothetical protein [uncultured Tolumonas sp.]|uniref:hypothetical protein n=1 Tax=uncultured Tolumonas sp. TaxID=263765 RepID=UPI002A0A9B4F|nr:hypothetical protein [uncultured Tolumonas sp.]
MRYWSILGFLRKYSYIGYTIPTFDTELDSLNYFEFRRVWEFHRQNYKILVLLNGMSVKEYANLYHLDISQTYFRFRDLGIAQLKRDFWARHKKQYAEKYAPKGLSVAVYISDHGLLHKTAYLELSRKPLSSKWEYHRARYEALAATQHITIAQYAETYGLHPATARRYIRKI